MNPVGSMRCQAERLHGLQWVRRKVGFSSKPQLDTIPPPSSHISPYENAFSNRTDHGHLYPGDRSEATCCHGISRANDNPNPSLAHSLGDSLGFLVRAKTDFQGSGQPQRARNLDLEECPLCSQGLHLQKSAFAEILSQIRLVRTSSQIHPSKRLFAYRGL